MVWIEIDDEIWDLYKRSWTVIGVKTHAELIRMLECYLKESSIDVLEDTESSSVSDEPEALVRREIGIMKERLKKLGLKMKEHKGSES